MARVRPRRPRRRVSDSCRGVAACRAPLILAADAAVPCGAAAHPIAIGFRAADSWSFHDAYARLRRPVQPASTAARAGVHARRRLRARARHRRQHRHLQHRQHGVAASAAVRGTGSPGSDLSRAAAGDVPRHAALLCLGGQLLRLETRRAPVRADGPVSLPPADANRRWPCRGRRRRCGWRGILRDAADEAAAGACVHRRRGCACARPCCRPQQRILEEPLRRLTGCDRPHAHARRRDIYRDWRHAGGVFDRVVEDHAPRHLGANRLQGCRTGRPRQSQRRGRRETEARRGSGGGRSGNARHFGTARAGVPEGERGLGRDGRSAAGTDRRRHPDVARHAARGGGARPAHCMRERRQSAVRSGAQPRQGARDSRGARRRTRARVPATHCRGDRARDGRRRCRFADCARRLAAGATLLADQVPARTRSPWMPA